MLTPNKKSHIIFLITFLSTIFYFVFVGSECLKPPDEPITVCSIKIESTEFNPKTIVIRKGESKEVQLRVATVNSDCGYYDKELAITVQNSAGLNLSLPVSDFYTGDVSNTNIDISSNSGTSNGMHEVILTTLFAAYPMNPALDEDIEHIGKTDTLNVYVRFFNFTFSI